MTRKGGWRRSKTATATPLALNATVRHARSRLPCRTKCGQHLSQRHVATSQKLSIRQALLKNSHTMTADCCRLTPTQTGTRINSRMTTKGGSSKINIHPADSY